MVDKTFRPENFEKGSNREKGKEVRSYETGSSSRSGAEREKGKGVEKDYSSGSGLSKRDKSITEILCEKQIKAAKQLKNGSDLLIKLQTFLPVRIILRYVKCRLASKKRI